MATGMRQRRATAAEWAANNEILADGVLGWEEDTGLFKIGDGVTHWVDLPDSHVYIPRSSLDGRYLARSIIDAAGDLLVGSTDNTATRLAKGTAGQRLTIAGDGTLVWADLPVEDNPMVVLDAAGDMIVGVGDNAAARLPKGTAGQILSMVAGMPAWITPATSNDLEVLYWTGP